MDDAKSIVQSSSFGDTVVEEETVSVSSLEDDTEEPSVSNKGKPPRSQQPQSKQKHKDQKEREQKAPGKSNNASTGLAVGRARRNGR